MAKKRKDNNRLCPKCGLRIVNQQRAGALTGHLLEDMRCKCPADQRIGRLGSPTKNFPAKTAPGHLNGDQDPQNKERFRAWPAILMALILVSFGGLAYFALTHWKEPGTQLGTLSETHTGKTISAPADFNPRADLASRPGKQSHPEWDGKPFFKGVKKLPGGDIKLWQFPIAPDGSLGYMLNLSRVPPPSPQFTPGITQWEMLAEEGRFNPTKEPLSSKIEKRLNDRVAIIPGNELLDGSTLVKGITDGNFDTIIFKSQESVETFEKSDLLPRLKSISGLIIGYDLSTEGEQDFLPLFKQFPKLTRLTLGALVHGQQLSEFKGLSQLRLLALARVMDDFALVTAALKGSTNLEELYLRDCPVSANNAFKDLSRCPNLVKLSVRSFEHDQLIPAGKIADLAALKKLSYLQLEKISYSPSLIKVLAAMPSLRCLQCEVTKEWSDSEKQALRAAMPSAELWLSWKVEEDRLQFCRIPRPSAGGRISGR